MKKVFFTPGPSQLYPSVEKHIQSALELSIASISHRGRVFQEIFASSVSNLKKLLSIPDSHHIFFLSSGTEAMERVIENVVSKESFHFVNGSFAERFYKTAQELGKQPQKTEVELGEGFQLERFDVPRTTELICFTQNETSTGVAIPLQDIYMIQNRFPKMLTALDIVSSVPYCDVDYSKIDLVFFSVQKGFGLPAGLGILVVSPRAYEKSLALAKKGISIGSYHSFPSLQKYAEKNQTPETPNVLEIYLLNKVIQDLLKKGIDVVQKETEEKALLLYDFFDRHSTYKPFVKVKKWRSQTVIVIEIPDGSKPVIERLKKEGIVVGSGYGKLKETQIRIANFPAIHKRDVKMLLETFQKTP